MAHLQRFFCDMKLDLRLRLLEGDDIAMGPGKADLLEAIAQTGSISGAGRMLNMSYRRAWQLVDLMNRLFREPVVRGAAGGAHGGGAQVTEFGQLVLARYRTMEAAAATAASAHVAGLVELVRNDLPDRGEPAA
jgi:molybdate transport system regulatory protein